MTDFGATPWMTLEIGIAAAILVMLALVLRAVWSVAEALERQKRSMVERLDEANESLARLAADQRALDRRMSAIERLMKRRKPPH